MLSLAQAIESEEHVPPTESGAICCDKCVMQDSACHLLLGLGWHHQVPNLANTVRGQSSYLLGNSGRGSISILHR